MVNVTQAQAQKRFQVLPEAIQDAMFSVKSADIISSVCSQNHLSDEKTAKVSESAGWVLLGFIHPEDLAGEIRDSAGIDIKIATPIADQISTKIFQPLREEIEQIYSPSTEGDEGLAEKLRPVSLEEIASAAEAAPAPAPVMASPVPPANAPEPAKTASVPAPAPAAISSVAPAAPTSAAAAEAPAPAQKPAPGPGGSRRLPVNMFSSLPGSPSRMVRPAAPVEAAPAAAPAKEEEATAAPASAIPFILHEEAEAQPITPVRQSFKVGLSEEQLGKMEQKWTPQPKAAQVETSAAADQKPADSDSRVVHYNEMRTPLPPPAQAEVRFPQPQYPQAVNPFEILRRNGNTSK